MDYSWNRDCKEFLGNYACEVLKTEGYKDCSECKFYDPKGKKILIIKLGAKGDVIRTLSILPEIKKKYPDSHVTWLIDSGSVEILEGNPNIDKILSYNFESYLRLKQEKFDVLFCLEITSPATLLSNEINADEKYGYYFDKDGHPSPFNESAHYYLERVFSDHTNKTNRKTYQEMMFDICNLSYEKHKPKIYLSEKENKYAEEFKKQNKINEYDKLIGIHIGTAGRWVSKAWHVDETIKLISKLLINYKVLLFAGPDDIKQQEFIRRHFVADKLLTNNPNNSLKEFFSLVNICEVMLTNDSLALHAATALNKKTISLFFCTPPWEVESYGLVAKIVSPLLEKYFYSDLYHEDLVKSITAEEVYNELTALISLSN